MSEDDLAMIEARWADRGDIRGEPGSRVDFVNRTADIAAKDMLALLAEVRRLRQVECLARDTLTAYATDTDWELSQALGTLNHALGDPLDMEDH